ncbi:heme o synthase [Paenibacillus sp. J2TS4]|uniref:heme o synthase n=1 Tax=Paenibacillus sp. J2TS4 TaxID=2807194 RepID=UPI001B2956C4|nr:heme o synthase [Paenibacillus sp. J2TS4]GIP31791.1 protoheme IX farnesyltransferase 1 [Paenibacillus sp. J2TS4]
MSDLHGASVQPFPDTPPWKDWISVIKPGIMTSNLFCAFAGYCLASRWNLEYSTLLFMLVGTALVIASASMMNNFLDRTRDLNMHRTRNRPLPSGRLKPRNVLAAGIGAGLVGLVILYVLVNPLSMVLGFIGIFVYVGIYTAWLKPTSTWSTSIGGISGSMPPMIGYCSFSNKLELGAWLLFFFLFLWQPPHFWALGILKKEEYREAGYPLLPVVKGVRRTKIQMLPYIAALFPVNYLLFDNDYVGVGYLIVTEILLIIWFLMSLQGLVTKHEAKWAAKHFRFSLYLLMVSFSMILIETAIR